MKKSLLSLALAGSMLSALAVPAFAATPSDVVGKDSQSAVEQLTALGIVQGYADGTFKPDNTITRAELAKIVIVATGNESSANLMANTAPAFKDVKKGAWYTGYINAAAAKGFIQGYNNKFRPNDTIKFEEVVAILVRALGYQDKYLSGSWPYNVLLQADEVGLFNGVDAANGTNATRGIVAELTSNTLDKQLVAYNADAEQFYGLWNDVDGDGDGDIKKLFISKLGAFDPASVLTAGALNSNGQISLNGTSVATASNFFVTGGKKLSELLGHTVSVLKNKDGAVIAVTDATEAAKIVNATSDAVTIGAGTTFKVNDGGASYTAATGVKVYVNSVEQTTATYALADGKEVQLLLDSKGNVQAILVSDWSSNHVFQETVAYSNYSKIVAKDGYSVKVDANTAITVNGTAAKLTDLKENDSVNVSANADGLALKVAVTRNVVTGKLQGVGQDKDGKATYVIEGKAYSNYSLLSTATLPVLTTAQIGTEYSLYLNKDGQVVYYTTTAPVSATNYAVIYSVDNSGTYSTLVNGLVKNGLNKVVYYSLKDNTKVTAYTDDNDYVANTLVPLKFNGDGLLKLIDAGDVAASVAAPNTDTSDDLTSADIDAVTGPFPTVVAGGNVSAVSSTQITAAGTTFRVNSNTVYLKYKQNGADSTVTTATAADVLKGGTVAVRSNDSGVAQYVVVLGNGSVDQLTQTQGLFISKFMTATSTSSADNVYTINLNVKGETKAFNVDATTYGKTYASNDVVKLTDAASGANAGDGKYDDAAIINTVAATFSFTDIGARKLAVAGFVNPVIVTDNTQIFLKKTDGTVVAGDITNVLDAADNYDATAAGDGTYNAGSYRVVVQGSGTNFNGNDEAGVIFVIDNN